MIQNKRGQTIVTVLFLLITGLLIWVLALAPQLSYWGAQAASQTTGLEAFLWSNLNLWVFIGMLLFAAVATVYVSAQ